MFYKTGVDITNDKSMFNFLNNHFTYNTMNSWNRLASIANNVKVHKLNLKGDCWAALAFLQKDEYFNLNEMIHEWESKHPGYECGFNGRSGGYLVLYNKGNNLGVLPDELVGYDSYEDWKSDIKGYGYRVCDFHNTLVEYTKLVQDFDRLCDQLRDYVDELSVRDFTIDSMEDNIDRFNDEYYDDFETLNFSLLEVDSEGKVDVTEVKTLKALYEALLRSLDQKDLGYKLIETEDDDKYYLQYKD